MYSGNQTFINPLDTLLKVAKELKFNNSIIIIFIGNGNYHQKIIDFKKKFNLKNVLILDYLPLKNIKYSLNAADIHAVSLGNKMKGIIHPCKIYNLIVLGKPILYFGPRESHIGDIIKRYKIGISFKHSQIKKTKKTILSLKKNKKMFHTNFKKIKNPFNQKILLNNMIYKIISDENSQN